MTGVSIRWLLVSSTHSISIDNIVMSISDNLNSMVMYVLYVLYVPYSLAYIKEVFSSTIIMTIEQQCR